MARIVTLARSAFLCRSRSIETLTVFLFHASGRKPDIKESLDLHKKFLSCSGDLGAHPPYAAILYDTICTLEFTGDLA
jgi:hypothetical protein